MLSRPFPEAKCRNKLRVPGALHSAGWRGAVVVGGGLFWSEGECRAPN